MRVELINTGTELLLGSVLNTHLRSIAEALFPLGLRVARQVTVPDGPAIRDVLAESFARAEIVIVTGGLGPTTDDITREAVAELLGVELIHDAAVSRAIAARFSRRGLAMTARVNLQALRPREAIVLPNAHGTAPGLYLAARAQPKLPHLFLLPGPPRELVPMLHAEVLPLITGLLPPDARPEMRTYRVLGMGESAVEDLVGAELLSLGIELGYCARPGAVDLRIIGAADLLEQAGNLITGKLGINIFSEDDSSLEQVVIGLLTSGAATVSTAESCTGGLIAHRLTNVPGASAAFLAGYVTYSNEAKTHSLGVEPALLAEHGAVSEPVARAMAEGARRASGADYALATTGIAGPGGGTPEKPVGTVFVALAGKNVGTVVEQHRYPTDRETFKQLVAQTALDLLRRSLPPTARS